jgi:hypothetical protein
MCRKQRRTSTTINNSMVIAATISGMNIAIADLNFVML